MPHFIAEYTDNIEQQADLPGLFEKVHETLGNSGVFPLGGIRSRGVRLDTWRMADGKHDYAFVHMTLKVGHGRDLATRQKVAQTLFDVITRHFAGIVTAEPLLNSSSAAYAKADINDLTTMEREEGDADGPFALAVWARNEDTGAEVLWIGCPNMDNEQLYQSMPGNLTFLQGCAASLVGQDVLVDTKALEAEPITVAGSTAAALGLTFVFVLPAAVLIAGAVVVLLRRRR